MTDILSLVQAMNRAKENQRTDDEQAEFDKVLAYCQRYVKFVEDELERDESFDIAAILKFHMTSIACGFWRSGLLKGPALICALGLGTILMQQVEIAYKDGPATGNPK